MIMVLLVLKLFVSSRPLKLEGVLCIYVFFEFYDSRRASYCLCINKRGSYKIYIIYNMHKWRKGSILP
jgi:hypothetical protein